MYRYGGITFYEEGDKVLHSPCFGGQSRYATIVRQQSITEYWIKFSEGGNEHIAFISELKYIRDGVCKENKA